MTHYCKIHTTAMSNLSKFKPFNNLMFLLESSHLAYSNRRMFCGLAASHDGQSFFKCAVSQVRSYRAWKEVFIHIFN